MRNQTIKNVLIGVTCFIVSPLSFAADDEMKKDEWLAKLKDVVPAMICKNFMKNEGVSKQLSAFKIDYNKCVSLIPESVDKCREKFYKDIPAMINKDNAQQWGGTLGQCIGTDFAVTYLSSAAPASAAPAAPASSDSANHPTSAEPAAATTPNDASSKQNTPESSSPTTTPPATMSGSESAPTQTTPEPTVPAPSTTESQPAPAANAPVDASGAAATKGDSANLTKDAWIAKLKDVVPDLICKGFLADESLGKQLVKLKIDYAKCVTLIPASFDKCTSQFYSAIPATIDDTSAGKWGHTIGECIGKDFAIKYLL